MNEITLSEEQLDKLASMIAEKLTNIKKHKEDEKIQKMISQAAIERQSRSFR